MHTNVCACTNIHKSAQASASLFEVYTYADKVMKIYPLRKTYALHFLEMIGTKHQLRKENVFNNIIFVHHDLMPKFE